MAGAMNQGGLLTLYEYNQRAVTMVLDVADQLTEEEFDREVSPSHGSVRRLLVHSMATEANFLAACQGHNLDFEPNNFQKREEIRAYWDGLEHRVRSYIQNSDQEELRRELDVVIRGEPLHLAVWQLLLQAFIHATHHRGELSIALSELDHPLPTLDIIIHFVEESGQSWPG